MIASLLEDLETNHPYFVPFLLVNPLFGWAPAANQPSARSGVRTSGVIADEAGVAVEAIKAWGKELMGWWLGWGFERKGRYLSYAINVCVYSQRTWIWGRNQRRGCTCKLTTYILHVIRPAPKCPLGWSLWDFSKTVFFYLLCDFGSVEFSTNTHPTNIKQVYSSLIEC